VMELYHRQSADRSEKTGVSGRIPQSDGPSFAFRPLASLEPFASV
jgi:hypothetical protein